MENGDSDDEFFGAQEEEDGSGGEMDGLAQREFEAHRERFRNMGYHAAFDETNEQRLQQGFEDGYRTSFRSSQRIGQLLGQITAQTHLQHIHDDNDNDNHNNRHDDDDDTYQTVRQRVRGFLLFLESPNNSHNQQRVKALEKLKDDLHTASNTINLSNASNT